MSISTSNSTAPAAFDEALEAYLARTSGSRAAWERAQTSLAGGVTRQTLSISPYPPFVTEGSGCELVDADGNRYIDFVNNYTSLIHGHAHRATVAAVSETLATIGTAPGLPTQLEHEFAAELCRRYPRAERIRLALSGSEGVGYAIRVARAATERQRILKFEGGFHGSFNETQQNIAQPPIASGRAAEGTAAGAGVGNAGTVVAVYNDIASVADAFERWGSEIACVIVEPFLGNGGLLEAAPGFLAAVAALAAGNGALFVLDEVQSCRLAFGGAQEAHGVAPDLTIAGKTIGGGMPLAAILGSAETMSFFSGEPPPISQTGTFNAFPPSLAAGLATLAEYRHAEIEALNNEGEQLRTRIRQVFEAHNLPAWVGGTGSMFHIALSNTPISHYADLVRCDTATWQIIHLRLLTNGIYLMPRGTGCLSTAMGRNATDALIDALDASLTSILAS